MAASFSGTLDFGLVEARLGGVIYLFSPGTPSGAALQSLLSSESQLLFGEIGRYAALGGGYFGRFALAVHQALPDSQRRWIAPSMEVGLAAFEKSPWTLSLKVAPFFPLHEDAGALLLSLHAGRRYEWGSREVEVGGFLAWTYRLRESLPPPGVYEHFALTVGPVGSIDTGLGRLGLRLAWRLTIEKETYPAGSPVEVAYPNEITVAPDALLTWEIAM